MATSDHYDVIVIGSGPGGASLAHRLAATGKRILMLERGDYLPRSRRNWDSKTVFVDGAYQAQDTWYGADGRSFHPGLHYYRRRQLQGVRRRPVPPPRARLRRAAAQGRHLSRVAAGLRRVRAVLYAGRGAVSRARAARRRSHRTLVQRPLRLSAGAARAAHPGTERHPATRGAAPVPSAARHQARPEPGRQRHHLQPVHPLRRVRRLPLPDQRQGRRPGDLRGPHPRGVPQFHAADATPTRPGWKRTPPAAASAACM